MKKLIKHEDGKIRCGWLSKDPLYVKYHDKEWGVPEYEDKKHFEFLTLESAQAGLSWITILKRREGYRNAFYDFDPHQVKDMSERDVKRLKSDTRIIRNEMKIRAAIHNASRFIEIQKEFGSFAFYFWSFVNGSTIQNNWKSLKEVPATTFVSDELAFDLKKRGFKFLGSTTVYAHLQAAGLVNDHTVDCFRHRELFSP